MQIDGGMGGVTTDAGNNGGGVDAGTNPGGTDAGTDPGHCRAGGAVADVGATVVHGTMKLDWQNPTGGCDNRGVRPAPAREEEAARSSRSLRA